MAATNVVAYRVYGDVSIQIGTAANNALETLGVTGDGGTIRITHHRKPVYSDVGGPETPVEMQDMGETARINVSLIAFNEDVYRRMKARAKIGNQKAGVAGDITPRGRLLGTDGGLFQLFIPPMPQTNTTVWEESWYFGSCDLDTEPVEDKVGTVITAVKLSFFAFPYIPGNLTRLSSITADSAFGKLYIRTNSATAPTNVLPT